MAVVINIGYVFGCELYALCGLTLKMLPQIYLHKRLARRGLAGGMADGWKR